MITLTRKLKREADDSKAAGSISNPTKRVSVRDKLLIKEVRIM